jgi:hypothetical protein
MKQKTNKNQVQQGDVLFFRRASLPSDAKQHLDRTIARGESTGHAHVLENTRGARLFESSKGLWIDAEKEVGVTHEEHGRLTLDRGIWEIGTVRELDWFEQIERRVSD